LPLGIYLPLFFFITVPALLIKVKDIDACSSAARDEMNEQRLLIIGSRGFLGTHTVQAAEAGGTFKVIRGDRSDTSELGRVEVDIADESSVDRAFDRARPDSVLLLAAMSDIDRCEANPEQAFAINARGVEHVANACARTNARLLFTSSAAVFDGKKHGYSEDDGVSPLSVYGETKARAESVVQSISPSAVVIRVALVLGFAHRRGTNALLDRLVTKWRAGEVVSFPQREQRNSIDAASLAKIMVNILANRDISGTYHVGASDSLSRYELGRRLAMRAGFSTDLVQPRDTNIPGRALRGEDHFLLTDKLRTLCNLEPQLSNQVIERCFNDAAKSN
jgi:dTDP-4-dehydrorhamnose reductase